jgi:hypothetical protein
MKNKDIKAEMLIELLVQLVVVVVLAAFYIKMLFY